MGDAAQFGNICKSPNDKNAPQQLREAKTITGHSLVPEPANSLPNKPLHLFTRVFREEIPKIHVKFDPFRANKGRSRSFDVGFL